MLQQVISTYHRFANWTRRPASTRPLVSLHVVALEERATPTAAPILTPVGAVPDTVQVAHFVAAPVVGPAIPLAGQSMVRLDLIAPGESPHADQGDDWGDLGSNPDVFAKTPRHEPETPVLPQKDAEAPVVSEEELADLIAARHNAEEMAIQPVT